MARKKMKRFSEGGPTAAEARRARKLADIESDYQKWLKSGRYGNADVARAKYDQRKADLADDYAKWTGGDRTNTRVDEQAAERRLSEARRTKGESMRRAAAVDVTQTPDPAALAQTLSKGLDSIKAPAITPTRSAPRRAAAPVRRPQAAAPAPSRPASGVTLSGDALAARQAAEAAREEQRRKTLPTAASPRSGPETKDEFNARVRGKMGSIFGQALGFLGNAVPGVAAARAASYLGRNISTDVDPGELSGYRAHRKGGTVKKAKGGAIKKKPVKKSCGGMAKYAKGGSIDGCAVRGHTRAKRSK